LRETQLQEELDRLKLALIRMAALAERAVGQALRALVERDVPLAAKVLQDDEQIDKLEVEVDRMALRLLALQHPLARDLRFVVGGLRIAVDLERIGDQAVNIAQRVQFLSSRPPLPRNTALEEMGDAAREMLKQSILAFVNQNAEQAMSIGRMDNKVDELNVRVLKNLVEYMMGDAPAVERSVQTIIAARCIERLADHSTNIAESVAFMVNGDNIKHLGRR
jgi:phosphate transport system protein